MPKPPQSRKVIEEQELTHFQEDVVEMFVNVAAAFALPRSLGAIYGLLYSVKQPLSLEEIADKLKISRGSASQGIRWLKDVGAIVSVFIPGVRKEHFAAQTELRRIAGGFIREQVEPHMENGGHWLERVERSVDSARDSEREFARDRYLKLRSWHRVMKRALPLIQFLASRI